MNIFSYNDYVKSIHTIRINAILEVAESGESYKLYNSNISIKREKEKSENKVKEDLKKILKDKKELAKFINEFLEPREKISYDNLIYTNSFEKRMNKIKSADIICKHKNKEVFFLIEYLSEIDHNIAYKLLTYCIEIVQDWVKNRNLGKVAHYPIVIPIIIYTGSEKWTGRQNPYNSQMKNTLFRENGVNLKYNIIEINNFGEDFLLKRNSLFSYRILAQRYINNEKDKLEKLKNIMVERKISKEKISKIIGFDVQY